MARAVPLLVAVAAVVIVFVAVLPRGDRTVGTEPPELADAELPALPIDILEGFFDSLNAGDVDAAHDLLDPGAVTVFLPGVAGMVEPSPSQVRDALERYRRLGQTIAVEECNESTAPLVIQTGVRTLSAGDAGGTVIDCTMLFESSFGRRIGVEDDPRLFMRFDIGERGIAAMYLSPVLEVGR